jgi:hypothetical protein
MLIRPSALQVDDEEFLVASLIDRCPKTMMLRELLQNAIEAAKMTPGGEGVITIEPVVIGEVRKLSICNTGPGMGPENLRRMSDIASSIGKVKSLTDNFGMGGKVASLPSNHLGVRYRSCADGRVSEIVIGKYDGVYGRQLRHAADEELTDVIDVSHDYDTATLARDWTQVVLLGHSPQQDTVIDPYAGDPPAREFWIPETLYQRFLRIPDGIRIEIAEGLQWFSGPREFQSIARRWSDAFARHEAVGSASGVTIHYLYDPAHSERPWENSSSEGALQTSSCFGAVAYRNEFYDLQLGSSWIYDLPRYGIPFDGRHFSVVVELPDDFAAVPDTYRQFLRYAAGDQADIKLADFRSAVNACRPKWLRDHLGALAHSAAPHAELTQALRQFRKELGVTMYEHVEHAPGNKPSSDVLKIWREPELEINQLEDQQDINDRWLDGRAACFYPETHQLFVNCGYAAFGNLTQELKLTASRDGILHGEISEFDTLLRGIAREALVRRLARSVFYGLAKRSDPEHWQKAHIQKALSPEALSIIADEWRDLLPMTASKLRKQLGLMARAPADTDAEPAARAGQPAPAERLAAGNEASSRPRIRKVP